MKHAVRHRPPAIRIISTGCAIAALIVSFDAWAQGASRMLPFNEFYDGAGRARFEDYARKDGVKVTSADEFQKMKAHIVSTYQGVKVSNSFVLGEGDVIDCIDRRTQPALRKPGGGFGELAKPPAPTIAKERRGDEAQKGQQVGPMLDARKKDPFGNVQYCKEGLIPMRRITLDELVRYETLNDFFNKYGKAGEKGLPEPERK